MIKMQGYKLSEDDTKLSIQHQRRVVLLKEILKDQHHPLKSGLH